MSDGRCRATTRAQWYGPGHPCRCVAWKDGLCRTHYAYAQRRAKTPDSTIAGFKKRNEELRAKVGAQRKALRLAAKLLLKSANPFDAACVAIRKALTI